MFPFFLPMIRRIEEGHWYLAEDYAFCQRARDCGYRIFADASIRLWHIGTYRYGWEDAGMERQRFGTFTLNFGPGPGAAGEKAVERPPAVEDFAAQYAWPPTKPDVRPFPQRNGLCRGAQEALARSVSQTTKLIVEVGSWTGRSTRFLAGLAPQATVIAIDHWQGRSQQRADPELAEFLPQLHETFLSECWNHRNQIIPVKADLVEGLQQVADAGLQADLVDAGSTLTMTTRAWRSTCRRRWTCFRERSWWARILIASVSKGPSRPSRASAGSATRLSAPLGGF
jgi:hypothetical protein